MIVEDTPATLFILTKLIEKSPELQDLSPSVYGFLDPIVASSQYDSVKPDVLIVDYMLPNLTGFEFLDSIRWNAETGPRAALFTAHWGTSDFVEREMERYGISTLIKKPLEFDAVVRFIREAASSKGKL